MRTTNLPDPMTRRQGDPLSALLKTAKAMRAAQQKYFAARGGDRQALVITCKKLEQSFDALLDAYPDPEGPAGDLFAPDPSREENTP